MYHSLMIESGQTRHLPLSQGRIAYEISGDGPLVVLSPGMGELRSTYRLLVPRLVRAGLRVVSVDLRGHGDSDATFAQYGDSPTAQDLGALIEHLGEPAVVVGNSMSAGAAVILAAESPRLVRGLVLTGPFVRPPTVHPAMALVFRILTARPWAAVTWNAYLPHLYAGDLPADFAQYRAAVRDALRRPGYARAFSRTTRADHGPAERALAAVHAPSLIVMGENDPDFPDPRAEAEWIGSALAGRVVMVPRAGHYPHVQQPDVTADAIIHFIEEELHRA
ncbi:2-(acetamidomethylene)succinate hydrolase [Microbacterium sp. TNHR37B]|nr:2-(acetamidomethylene)succinate hydrolase [Microbacterium sp. TNHR37B]